MGSISPRGPGNTHIYIGKKSFSGLRKIFILLLKRKRERKKPQDLCSYSRIGVTRRGKNPGNKNGPFLSGDNRLVKRLVNYLYQLFPEYVLRNSSSMLALNICRENTSPMIKSPRGRPQCTRASHRLTEGLQFENVSHSPISLIIYLLIKCFCGVYYLPGSVPDPLQTFTILTSNTPIKSSLLLSSPFYGRCRDTQGSVTCPKSNS